MARETLENNSLTMLYPQYKRFHIITNDSPPILSFLLVYKFISRLRLSTFWFFVAITTTFFNKTTLLNYNIVRILIMNLKITLTIKKNFGDIVSFVTFI